MDTLQKKKRLPVSSFLAVLVKGAKLTKFVKLFKMLKFTKIFLTMFSMVLSVLVYSFSMGLWFAVGFVMMIFIHEMGHVLALIKKGYKASAPVFIPMVGAVIFAPKFNNPEEEAYVGYGGPFIGGLGALALFGLWAVLPQRHDLLLLISYTATFINLFNLIPIRPLDGGRITHVVGGWFKWGGLAALLAFSLYIKQPSILLIWILVMEDVPLAPPLKFGMGLTCWVSMTSLMFMGYGEQGKWINLLDMILGGFIVTVMYSRFRGYVPEEEKELVHTPMEVKVKWFALYIALGVGLAALMALQAQYLPHAAHK